MKLEKKLKILIEKYKKDIEQLKKNDDFNNSSKIQSVCIFREIIQDLEIILIDNNLGYELNLKK